MQKLGQRSWSIFITSFISSLVIECPPQIVLLPNVNVFGMLVTSDKGGGRVNFLSQFLSSKYKCILTKGNSYVGQRLADADDDIVAAVSNFEKYVSEQVSKEVRNF